MKKQNVLQYRKISQEFNFFAQYIIPYVNGRDSDFSNLNIKCLSGFQLKIRLRRYDFGLT